MLGLLRDRKVAFARSTAGAPFDLLELGGGDASSTVISPKIFDRFVAPFDAPIVAAAHEAGQRIVYHTCGGMMPLLEQIAAMQPDAMETFTPKEMGGDTRLAEAKARIGSQVCMIGGFDQFHYFTGCTPGETRRAVRDAFDAAGRDGGFILAPSDHFFEADDALLRAFADEARRCRYRGQKTAGFLDLTPQEAAVEREGAREVARGVVEDRLQVAVARRRRGVRHDPGRLVHRDELARDVRDLAVRRRVAWPQTHSACSAAPYAAPSSVAGQTTGQSNTSAAIWRHTALRAPPPVSRISRGDRPSARIRLSP